MRLAFTEEQLEIRDAVRDALSKACGPDVVRAAWEARPAHLWPLLAELGVLGINAPEDAGGLGAGAADWVLLMEACGAAALPEPVIEAIAAAPLLAEAGEADLLSRLVRGEAKVAIALEAPLGGGYALDADVADCLLRVRGGRAYRVLDPRLTPQPALDGARRLFSVAGDEAPLVGDAEALVLRGALAASAQLVGLGQYALDAAVEYAKAREQFGKPIGSFQAVQRHLVDAALGLRFAAPMVYRAAGGLDADDPDRALHVGMAKIYASEAAARAARASLQVHGAIGYTFELDLHLWMKRIWALGAAWGDPAAWRDRCADALAL